MPASIHEFPLHVPTSLCGRKIHVYKDFLLTPAPTRANKRGHSYFPGGCFTGLSSCLGGRAGMGSQTYSTSKLPNPGSTHLRRERRTVAGQLVHSALYGTSESGDGRKEVWGWGCNSDSCGVPGEEAATLNHSDISRRGLAPLSLPVPLECARTSGAILVRDRAGEPVLLGNPHARVRMRVCDLLNERYSSSQGLFPPSASGRLP